MNNPIDAALSRWNLTDPSIPITLATWTAVHPGRMSAAMAAIAKLPRQQRTEAIVAGPHIVGAFYAANAERR